MDFGGILASASGSPWVRTEYPLFQRGFLIETKSPPTYTKLTAKGHVELARLARKHAGFWKEILRTVAKDKAISPHPADTNFAQIFELTTLTLHDKVCRGGKTWSIDQRYKGSGGVRAQIPCT